MSARIVRRSFARPGRIVPPSAKHLRGRSIHLVPGRSIAWHTTGRREEIVIAVGGRLWLEREDRTGRLRPIVLAEGQCVFLPSGVRHRVVNRSRQTSRYLYVTA